MSNINYKIPKIEAKVGVLLDEKDVPEVEEYILFLDQFSRYRKGKETIFEFLNKKKPNQFIPLKHCRTGEFVILNLDDIVYLEEREKTITQSHQKVDLILRNTTRLEVDHFNPLPDSQSRVLDYLNQEIQFILFYRNEHKVFINKRKIIRAKEK